MNGAGTAPTALMRRSRSSLISVQWVILGRASGRGNESLRPLERGEDHVDGDVAVGVAVDLDAGAVHPLDPGVEVVLGRGDVAVIGRLDARIGRAHRHRALRERAVAGVLGGGAEPDPLVAEAGLDAVLDHGLQHVVLRLRSSRGGGDRRARAPPAAPAGRRPRDARWSGRSGRTAWR